MTAMTVTQKMSSLFPNRASSPWTYLDPLMTGRAFPLIPKKRNTTMHGRVSYSYKLDRPYHP